MLHWELTSSKALIAILQNLDLDMPLGAARLTHAVSQI